MSKDNKIQMPSGMGGLVRYFDEYKSKLEISPGTVIILTILVAILMILLNAYGNAIFGL
ncbi:preprotein translocase subunit Sec61beta [Candidatus Woesearchaeota archaeon]|nr:preprotein translocase subunit Sec61beta [Candidatus Woesearchaeota archaeon]